MIYIQIYLSNIDVDIFASSRWLLVILYFRSFISRSKIASRIELNENCCY